MAEFVLTDAFCYVGGYDFTTDTNSASVTTEVAQLDATTFNSSGWNETVGGLKSTNVAWSGFWQSAAVSSDQAVDNQAFPYLGTTQPYTFGPVEVEGQVAYMFNAAKSSYSQGGAVGELAPFSLSATGSSPDGTIRGRLAKARGSVSATGQLGTAVNFGAVTSNQILNATLHLFTVGTTVTVTLESDDNSGFTSPTTRATFGPLTTSGGTWMTGIAGPITDGWYRFNVTAITGAFVVAAAFGKQTV